MAKNAHAVALGRKGGQANKGKTSPAKAHASRVNGQKGGRPAKKARAMKTLILVIVFVLAATAAHAQDAPKSDRFANLAPYVVMVGGNVADLWTTQAALSSGRGHEGNPAFERQQIGTLTAVKVCGAVTIGVIMRVLEMHGHPTAARVFGYVDGALTGAVAVHNASVGR